jgi:lipid-binding SYLF domain-containing protein
MNMRNVLSRWMFFLAMAAFSLAYQGSAWAETRAQLDQDAEEALKALYASSPTAQALGEKAKGILVFPNITKAGFIIGAQGGDGVLFKRSKVAGYYNTAAVSVGMQAGAQSFAFAIFFMSDKELKAFETSTGWEVGVGPSVVFIDTGMGKDISTLTTKSNIYAMIFDQKGLMAGVGLQGSKITKIGR